MDAPPAPISVLRLTRATAAQGSTLRHAWIFFLGGGKVKGGARSSADRGALTAAPRGDRAARMHGVRRRRGGDARRQPVRNRRAHASESVAPAHRERWHRRVETVAPAHRNRRTGRSESSHRHAGSEALARRNRRTGVSGIRCATATTCAALRGAGVRDSAASEVATRAGCSRRGRDRNPSSGRGGIRDERSGERLGLQV